MGISCGAQVIKYLLFFFNLLWLALGGVVIWLGFKLVDFSKDFDDINIEDTPRNGAIVLLVAGFVIFLIAFLGCCGAIKESSCLLSSYGGIILLLVVVQCVGVYFAFKHRTDVKKVLTDGIESEFGKYKTSINNDTSLRKAVNSFQRAFDCCGTTDDKFWSDDRIPASCCGHSNDEQKCERKDVTVHDGCVSKAYDKVYNFLGGLGGVAIALILIQLFIIMSACCLAREVRS